MARGFLSGRDRRTVRDASDDYSKKRYGCHLPGGPDGAPHHSAPARSTSPLEALGAPNVHSVGGLRLKRSARQHGIRRHEPMADPAAAPMQTETRPARRTLL
jgi:hypothetical protein